VVNLARCGANMGAANTMRWMPAKNTSHVHISNSSITRDIRIVAIVVAGVVQENTTFHQCPKYGKELEVVDNLSRLIIPNTSDASLFQRI